MSDSSETDEIGPDEHPDRFITKPGIVMLALAAQSYVIHLIHGLVT